MLNYLDPFDTRFLNNSYAYVPQWNNEMRRRRDLELYRRQQQEHMDRWQEEQERDGSYQFNEPPFRRTLDRGDMIEGDDNGAESKPQFHIVRGPDGRLYRVCMNEKKETPRYDTSKHTSQFLPTNGDSPLRLIRGDNVPIHHPAAMKTIQRESSNQSEHRIDVVVEDVSDSEVEEDEFKSIWRNRRPSPGEWMEPVEYDS